MDTEHPSSMSMDGVIDHTSTATLVAVAAIGVAVMVGGVVLDRLLNHPAG